MNKKTLLCAIPAVSLLLGLTGCQTTKINMCEYSPAVVVSITGNPDLPWYVEDNDRTSDTDGESGGVLSTMVNKVLEPNNPEYSQAKDRLNKADEMIAEKLHAAGIETVEKQVLLDSQIYAYSVNFAAQILDSTLAADGYRVLDSGSSKRNREICSETNAASTLYFSFSAKKRRVGVGVTQKVVKAWVELTVYGAAADGSKLFSATYSAESDDGYPYKNGSWNKQAVCDLIPGVMGKTVDMFLADYTGIEEAVAPEGEGAEAEESSGDDFVYTGTATSISIPVIINTTSENSDSSETEEEAGDEASIMVNTVTPAKTSNAAGYSEENVPEEYEQ